MGVQPGHYKASLIVTTGDIGDECEAFSSIPVLVISTLNQNRGVVAACRRTLDRSHQRMIAIGLQSCFRESPIERITIQSFLTNWLGHLRQPKTVAYAK